MDSEILPRARLQLTNESERFPLAHAWILGWFDGIRGFVRCPPMQRRRTVVPNAYNDGFVQGQRARAAKVRS